MKIIGTVIFNGSAESKNTYQLGVEYYKSHNPSSTLNGKLIVNVYRNFKGDPNQQGMVPSGWFTEQVMDSTALCIDGGTNWIVYPTKEAWDEIKEIIKNL